MPPGQKHENFTETPMEFHVKCSIKLVFQMEFQASPVLTVNVPSNPRGRRCSLQHGASVRQTMLRPECTPEWNAASAST